MNDEQLWKHALNSLNKGEESILVVIIHRVGSAPNVPGAKMLVTEKSSIGTVGGGISEHTLTERAQEMLKRKQKNVETIHMNHSEDAQENKSGMICSGSQIFALVPLTKESLWIIQEIYEKFIKAKSGILTISAKGISLEEERILPIKNIYTEEETWKYEENIGLQDRLIMIGGGHVSLALSQVMTTLNFHLTVIDDRQNLPTMNNNNFAHEKLVISYNDILSYVPEGNNIYVAIMTFGHTSDELVLEKLITKKLKYLGMMASTFKKQQVFTSLEKRGVPTELLEKIHSPIGVPIKSDTPEEIAISIAAEIIAVRNKR